MGLRDSIGSGLRAMGGIYSESVANNQREERLLEEQDEKNKRAERFKMTLTAVSQGALQPQVLFEAFPDYMEGINQSLMTSSTGGVNPFMDPDARKLAQETESAKSIHSSLDRIVSGMAPEEQQQYGASAYAPTYDGAVKRRQDIYAYRKALEDRKAADARSAWDTWTLPDGREIELRDNDPRTNQLAAAGAKKAPRKEISGSPGDWAFTSGGKNELGVKLRQQIEGVRNLATLSDRAIELSANGLTGNANEVFSLVKNTVDTALSLAEAGGRELSANDRAGERARWDAVGKDGKPLYQFDAMGWGKMSAELKSVLAAQAYAAAAAKDQRGQGLSDKDLQQQFKELGANISNPDDFAHVQRQFVQRAYGAVFNYVKANPELANDAGLAALQDDYNSRYSPKGTAPSPTGGGAPTGAAQGQRVIRYDANGNRL